jgi:gamma-glutamyltranspeptidase/glutathione hydrolase
MDGLVVCSQPRAAEVGVLMFEEGGNAVDAAVATAFAQAVIDPLNASVGGFGVAQTRNSGASQSLVLGFHARAPRAARADMFELTGDESSAPLAAGTFPVVGDANQIGYLSVGVPGTVLGLTELHREGGSLPLTLVMEPAIELCRQGWIVTGETRAEWTATTPPGRLDALSRFRATPAAERIYAIDGRLPEVGERLVNDDYGGVLATIAQGGASEFYGGRIAATIVADFAANGGLIDDQDLRDYHIDVGAPTESEYRGFRISVPPPPAGGEVVLSVLRRLEQCDLKALGCNTADYIEALANALREAFVEMRRTLGDPDFATTPQETTHVATIDEEGNCVSVTHSLGAASGVVTPGLGFLFNGAMHRFDPRPGRPNSIAPGKRRVSGIAPTIVWNGDHPWIILGAAGGHSIIAAIVQTIVNMIDFRMSPQAALAAPRFYCESDVVNLEARFALSTANQLRDRGLQAVISPFSYDRAIAGCVHCIAVTDAQVKPEGAADPRLGGIAMATAAWR